MNESESSGQGDRWTGWDQFWFIPIPADTIAFVRGVICLITFCYLVSCWSDLEFWYGDDGPFTPDRIATFLETGGVEESAAWILSPLFLTDSVTVYRVTLLLGMALAWIVALGGGGRVACVMLWLVLVSWANRAMILSGLTETLLSLGLFAAAIAPPRVAWIPTSRRDAAPETDWTARFAERLMAVQITLVGAATMITMLAGRVWFNGIGAYALAAPVQDRSIDWTVEGSLFVNGFVHESLTHALVLALPIGLAMAWIPASSRVGKAVLVLWCAAVALLGSHWLYASIFAAMVLAIRPDRKQLVSIESA